MCYQPSNATQFPESMSFGHMDSHTLTATYEETHTDDVKRKEKLWKKKLLWPASPFKDFTCGDSTLQLVKLQKRTSTIRKRPQMSSAGEFSSFCLILCSHKKQKERNLHSDLPQACGQAKSLKCLRLYLFFSSPSQASERRFVFFSFNKSSSPRHVSDSREALNLCVRVETSRCSPSLLSINGVC